MQQKPPDDRRLIAALLKDEKWQEAYNLLDRWCQRSPKALTAQFNRAYCLFRLRRFDEAGVSIPFPQSDVHVFKQETAAAD